MLILGPGRRAGQGRAAQDKSGRAVKGREGPGRAGPRKEGQGMAEGEGKGGQCRFMRAALCVRRAR